MSWCSFFDLWNSKPRPLMGNPADRWYSDIEDFRGRKVTLIEPDREIWQIVYLPRGSDVADRANFRAPSRDAAIAKLRRAGVTVKEVYRAGSRVPLMGNPRVDDIRVGDRVTIVNRFGQKSTGRAVMRSTHGGWVLNMGGRYGTPAVADSHNIVSVKKAR